MSSDAISTRSRTITVQHVTRGDLFSFIDEQILRVPRAFRSNYRNDQRALAIQKSESDRFDRQEKERDQDQEWIRMEKLGIWASGRPPELDTDLPDGSIIIFASKEQSDAGSSQ